MILVVRLRLDSSRAVPAICFFVAVALVALAVIVGTTGSPVNGTMEFELRKSLIQFFLIVALGAVVTFLADYVKRQREAADRQREYITETVRSLLGRLDDSYRAVKRTRRSLRLLDIETMTKEAYVDRMSKLSLDKEDIETLWRDMDELSSGLEGLTKVQPAVRSMEAYLNRLEDEFEDTAPEPDDVFNTDRLDRLKRFLPKWKTGESDFHLFRTDYYRARSALIDMLPTSKPVRPHSGDTR